MSPEWAFEIDEEFLEAVDKAVKQYAVDLRDNPAKSDGALERFRAENIALAELADEVLRLKEDKGVVDLDSLSEGADPVIREIVRTPWTALVVVKDKRAVVFRLTKASLFKKAAVPAVIDEAKRRAASW